MACPSPTSSRAVALGEASRRFVEAVQAADFESVDAVELEGLVEVLRAAQSAVEAGLVRCGLRADALAADGLAAPARDTLLGRGRVRGVTARQEARRVELARRSPALGRALSAGQLGPDHVDGLVRRLSGLDDDELGRVDLAPLLDGRGAELPADTFDAALRRAVEDATDDGGSRDAEARRAESEVRHWFDRRTGMGHLSGRFDAERYEAMVAALDQHTATLAARIDDSGTTGPVAKNANLAAEALVDLVCSSGARRPHLPHVTVVVDAATLVSGRHEATVAQTGDGHALSDEAVTRLGCDAVLRRVLLDERGTPTNVGRRHRTATNAQWAALRAVHDSCAWTGCDAPLSHCQAHHITPWATGGPTDLDNLVPLCTHHHHLVHEGRWVIQLESDRSLRIRRPDGVLHAHTPPPTRRPPPASPGDRHRTLTTEPLARAG